MSHMRAEMTGRQRWLAVDGGSGTTFVPADLVDCPELGNATPDDGPVSLRSIRGHMVESYPQTGRLRADIVWRRILDAVGDFYPGPADGITSVELVDGYGVRSSAPGYSDATDWSVFDSEKDANEAFAAERAGNGDDDDDDDDGPAAVRRYWCPSCSRRFDAAAGTCEACGCRDISPEPDTYRPGIHALTTDGTEVGLCATVAADGPKSVALVALTDWREEHELEAPGSAVEFFAWQTGCGLPGSADRLEAARSLAAAERWAEDREDFSAEWEQDTDYNPDDYDSPDMPPIGWGCVVRAGGEVQSLWSITFGGPHHEPDREPYARLVVAELTLELMRQLADAPPELIPAIPAGESE